MHGQSTDTDIDIHKNKTLEIKQSGIRNLETLTLTCTKKDVRGMTIRNGQSIDIDMHITKMLEM
jgi:hypothetical protein